MNRSPVKSSNITSIGYDTESEILEVEFSGARVYRYYDVPADLHAELMLAESHGSFLYENISCRIGGPLFEYEKISH
ncbi:MAG: KTSC domain-containing protein [Methylococcaceae bacterium]|nr:KTSC domain-containing protein [Methylococcaceae bacterium]